MGGAIAVRDELKDVREQLEKRQLAIVRSLPKGVISFERFEQSVMTILGANLKLLECNRASLVASVLRAAHLGLDLDPATGQAYFVPFKGIVQFIPGYKGLCQLAWRSGGMAKIKASAVRQGDEFDWMEGTGEYLRYKRTAPEAAPITHAWGLYVPNGSTVETFQVMPVEDIEVIRKRAPSAKATSSPWLTHYADMCIKTVLRRTLKTAPMSGERAIPLAKAMDLDERAELGLEQHNEEDLLDEEAKAKEGGADSDGPGSDRTPGQEG